MNRLHGVDDLVVGIDLGTTYSLIAHYDAGRPRLLPNALGQVLTPSAVHVDEHGNLAVGADARKRAILEPDRTAVAWKRDMGTERSYQLGTRRFTPEELSALVLGSLKRDAELALGRPVERAVITVPAYFGETQRRSTVNAAQMAGLTVERLVNEPTAAAIEYGFGSRERERTIAVLDLGGGTFDVTILDVRPDALEVRSTAGDIRLGGNDYTDVIASYVTRRFEARFGNIAEASPRTAARIWYAAEIAMHRLSSRTSTRVALASLDVGGRDVDFELTLDRGSISDELARFDGRLRAPIERALLDARVDASDVDEVLLVGGASRMPWFRSLVGEVFARTPTTHDEPDQVVALGAGIQAELVRSKHAIDDVRVVDIAPFTLGIQVGRKLGRREIGDLFAPIIERGTVLPASRVSTFRTVDDDQTTVDIAVFQGEHSLCSDNTPLGRITVHGIPTTGPSARAFDVRFTYDASGLLDVDVLVLGSGERHSLAITALAGSIDADTLAERRRRMEALKVHPRDTQSIRLVLARAEALYIARTGDPRDTLGRRMADLRVAIAGQEPDEVEEARRRLLEFVELLEGRTVH